MGILSIILLANQSKFLSSNFWRRILSFSPVREIQTKAHDDGHLKHNILKNDDDHRKFLIKRLHNGTSYLSLLSTETFSFSPEDNLCSTFSSKFPDHSVAGCSDGLLYIDDFDLSVGIWNPTTDEFKSVPPSPLMLQSTFCRDFYGCGFGFDSKSEDHKIIRSILSGDDEFIPFPQLYQTELYSLRTDSWKKISRPDCFFQNDDSIHVNGFYYWKGIHFSGGDVIIEFDFASEKFSFIPLPDPELLEGPYTYNLVEFDGLLAAVIYRLKSKRKQMAFYLWVWNDESWSWIRLSVIEVLGVARSPLGFVKNDKIFLEGLNGDLLLFDRATQEFKNLGVYADPGKVQILPFVESSFPLNGNLSQKKETKRCSQIEPQGGSARFPAFLSIL